jgi:hypothetical protein
MSELLVPRIIPGFDIMKCIIYGENCIYNYNKNMSNYERNTKNKYANKNKKLHPETPIFSGFSITQERFSRIVSIATLQMKLNKVQVNGIYKMLKHLLPDSDASIPISMSKNGQRVQGSLNDYFHNSSDGNCDSICISFDICTCGETIYVGEYSSTYQCSNCSTFRYNKCPSCHAFGDCQHKARRTPVKKLQYRPIIRIGPNFRGAAKERI